MLACLTGLFPLLLHTAEHHVAAAAQAKHYDCALACQGRTSGLTMLLLFRQSIDDGALACQGRLSGRRGD